MFLGSVRAERVEAPVSKPFDRLSRPFDKLRANGIPSSFPFGLLCSWVPFGLLNSRFPFGLLRFWFPFGLLCSWVPFGLSVSKPLSASPSTSSGRMGDSSSRRELNSPATAGCAHERGSVSPNTPQTVNHGNTASFTVTPESGYTTDTTVGGTYPAGSWSDDVYTTGAITANCTLSFSFTNPSFLLWSK